MTPKLFRGMIAIFCLSVLFLSPSFLKTAWSADRFAKPEFGGTCTQADPCYFVTAVNGASNGDNIYFKEGNYYDDNFPTHVLYVSKSVNLLGGWDGAPSGSLVRRPESYISVLDGKNLRRVIYINGLITPLIDGFTIANGNATGWATNCSGIIAKGCGGGIFVYRAGARIVNNKILNNKAHTIASESGYGGGIHLEEASGAVIRDNLIQGNQANPMGGDGSGGGMTIYGPTQNLIRINGNQFIGNSAAFGGGISSLLTQPQLVIYNNLFDNNSAQKAAAMAVLGGNTISKNLIQNNQGQETIFLTAFQGTFEGNKIVSNNTNVGIAMYLGIPPYPRFSNNFIAQSGTNGILTGATQQNPLFADMEHNTLVGGGGGAAVSIPANNYVTLTLTNNIIAGFPIGLDNNSPSTSTINAHYTLFAPDVANHGNNVNFDQALTGDPAFMNPADNDYHIRLISAAKDAGTSGIVATEDIDGDPRIIGSAPDIGADEFRPLLLHLPLIIK
jgi:hypothetical protein